MDVDADVQNSVQSPPQQLQAQTNPPPDDSSPATVPEVTSPPRPPPASDTNNIDAGASKKLLRETLCALSKTFGHIPDVPIFTQWDKRIDCLNAAVHRSAMAGICGNRKDGVYSVALSGSYGDNEDGGDVVLYTGAGGRQRWTDTLPPKRLRLGPQINDQSWDCSPNNALIVSFHTRNPVRVIRSWRCPSQYAPLQGYRYDGLYRVAAYWTAKGRNGKKICRCRLERLPGQPPIPVRPITFPASRRRARGRLVSRFGLNASASTNDVDMEPNQTNTSPAQLAGGTESESGKLPKSPQQQAMSEDFTVGEVNLDVKVLQSLSHQQQDIPEPGALPTYRWHPGKNVLVGLLASHPNLDTTEGEEEAHRGEDDATLVPSEDGYLNERMETVYFSDE